MKWDESDDLTSEVKWGGGMEKKANILVLGTSGAGKSTLINTVIGKEVAKVGNGKHGTDKMEAYESEDLSFRLIDSRGFEYGFWDTQRTIKDMSDWMKAGLKGEKPRIHMLWFCVVATSKRFSAKTMKTLEYVKREWKEIPIIVVLTISMFSPRRTGKTSRWSRKLSERLHVKQGCPWQ